MGQRKYDKFRARGASKRELCTVIGNLDKETLVQKPSETSEETTSAVLNSYRFGRSSGSQSEMGY